jgi:aryl-alcohol dehydrogenase-like predicted oxidoreductase
VSLGNELAVHCLGFGTMRPTGDGIWWPLKDHKSVLAGFRVLGLDVNFIDTADSYGPYVKKS